MKATSSQAPPRSRRQGIGAPSWGTSGKEARFLRQLIRFLSRMEEKDRKFSCRHGENGPSQASQIGAAAQIVVAKRDCATVNTPRSVERLRWSPSVRTGYITQPIPMPISRNKSSDHPTYFKRSSAGLRLRNANAIEIPVRKETSPENG